jgi:hypothetical protein
MRRALGDRPERAGNLSPADLLRMLHTLVELEPRFRRSGQQQLLLETLLVRFALLDRTVSLEDVLRGLDGGGAAPPRADLAAALRRPPGDERRPPTAGDARPSAAPAAPPRPAPRAVDAPAPARVEPPRSAAPAPPAAGGWSAPGAAAPSAVLAPPAPPAPSAALRPPPAERAARTDAVPDVSMLVERWDEVAAHARAAGRMIVAAAIQSLLPVGVTSSGVVTVQLEEPNDTFAQALEAARDDVLAAVRTLYAGATRVTLLRPDGGAPPGAPQRLTAESVKEERVATLRRRDPVLDTAVDVLDLDLVE